MYLGIYITYTLHSVYIYIFISVIKEKKTMLRESKGKQLEGEEEREKIM